MLSLSQCSAWYTGGPPGPVCSSCSKPMTPNTSGSAISNVLSRPPSAECAGRAAVLVMPTNLQMCVVSCRPAVPPSELTIRLECDNRDTNVGWNVTGESHAAFRRNNYGKSRSLNSPRYIAKFSLVGGRRREA